MFGHCLLISTGISAMSTGLYVAITEDKYDIRDRKNEYITIFTIIIICSTILMYLFNTSSDTVLSVINSEGGDKLNYANPPF